jgi:hypothetical protein
MSTTSTTSSLPTQGDLPPFLPLPEVDQNCRLLGPTALVVQALMGVLVLGSLLYKRHREKPKRAWKIWSVCENGLRCYNLYIRKVPGALVLTSPFRQDI